MLPNILSTSVERKGRLKMESVLRWNCHDKRLRLVPLICMTAIIVTTANAYSFSQQQNHIHLSLEYNQRSPTWARICNDLKSFPRGRRSVKVQDKIEGENLEFTQRATDHVSQRSIRSTTKILAAKKVNQTEPEIVVLSMNPSKIQVKLGINDTRLLTESERSKDKRKVDGEDLLATVSQQVSKIVTHKLLPAEGGHGKSHKKSHKSVHGGKGGRGHKSFHGHKSGKKGHHSEAGKKGFFDKGGKKKHGNNHEKHYHGSYKGGTKASKGHKKGFKKEHRKGHRDKGFKNKVHKKQYGFKKNFHDEDAFFKHFANQGVFKDHFSGFKGGAKKHSNHKGHKAHSDHGKKDFFDKGHYHVDDKGHKKHHGHKGYHGHRSSHGHY